jgi:hypothetical protein
MNTIQTENGTYVEVTEAEKVAIDKKWDYLEALTAKRIAYAKREGVYDSTLSYSNWWDNENTTVSADDYKSEDKVYAFSTIPWAIS